MDYRSVFPTLVNLTLLLPPPNLNPLAHTPTRTAFVEHREGSSIVAKVTKRTLDRLAVRRKYAHVFVTSTHRWVSCPVSLFTGEMSNQYPPQPSAPPGACAPPQAAYGQPVSGQPVPTLTPSATVTHVQYPPPTRGRDAGGRPRVQRPDVRVPKQPISPRPGRAAVPHAGWAGFSGDRGCGEHGARRV